jgi:hypothetical protein
MSYRHHAAELDLPQGERELRRRKRDQHQHSESDRVGEVGRLRLHLLQRLLILHARRDRMLDEVTLRALFAMRQHVGRTNMPMRPSGIARRIHQR